jgi:ribosome maturation factor RimP
VAGNRHWQGRLGAVADGKVTVDRSAIQAKGKATGKAKRAAATGNALVEIEIANIEKAQLIPEL